MDVEPPEMEQHFSPAEPGRGKWGQQETRPANSLLSYRKAARNCSRKNFLEVEQLQGCAPRSALTLGSSSFPPGSPP